MRISKICFKQSFCPLNRDHNFTDITNQFFLNYSKTVDVTKKMAGDQKCS